MAAVTKQNPRTLRHVRSGETVRCVNQTEYLTLTSAQGYRDVTDEHRAQTEPPAEPAPTEPAPTEPTPQQAAEPQAEAPTEPAPTEEPTTRRRRPSTDTPSST